MSNHPLFELTLSSLFSTSRSTRPAPPNLNILQSHPRTTIFAQWVKYGTERIEYTTTKQVTNPKKQANEHRNGKRKRKEEGNNQQTGRQPCPLSQLLSQSRLAKTGFRPYLAMEHEDQREEARRQSRLVMKAATEVKPQRGSEESAVVIMNLLLSCVCLSCVVLIQHLCLLLCMLLCSLLILQLCQFREIRVSQRFLCTDSFAGFVDQHLGQQIQCQWIDISGVGKDLGQRLRRPLRESGFEVRKRSHARLHKDVKETKRENKRERQTKQSERKREPDEQKESAMGAQGERKQDSCVWPL